MEANRNSIIVEGIKITSPDKVIFESPEITKETGDYFYIEDSSGLISEAQMGTLEFHTWGSRVDVLEKPDIMVFDLDPDEGMDLDSVRRPISYDGALPLSFA